jgi:hypothetical protein
MSTHGIAPGQRRVFASRRARPRAPGAWGNVVGRYLLVVACAALSLVPTASSSAASVPTRGASGAATFPPYPAKCPLTTKFLYGTNCLVDEGLRPCVPGKTPGCMPVTVGPGSAFNYFVPRANNNLRISASTMTVPIGGSVTVTASVAAPVCTFALVNAPGHPRCWDSLNFAGSTYYMPTNYNGEFTAPRLSFPPNCSVEGETSRDNPMSCTAKVLPPFGLRVLAGHYIVVVVETEVSNDGPLGELDVDEVALKIGPTPPCMGRLGAALEVPDRTGAALIPAAASSPHCLQVYIKIVGPIPNVGTRSGLSVDNYVPSDGPMNFTKGTRSTPATPLVESASTGQQCVSGCANILITVVDKVTHKAATDAHVNVDLGDIDTQQAPELDQQGQQFLCVQTDTGTIGLAKNCGTSLDDLKVDENGQVRLLYWAPGELVTAHAELDAQACTPAACLLKRATSKITVYPYRIFEYQGELAPETVVDLVTLVRGHGRFEGFSHFMEQYLERAADYFLDLQEVESQVVKLVLGPIGFLVAFTLIDLAHARIELKEEEGFRGQFSAASGLSGAGLEVPDQFAKKLTPFDAVFFLDQVLDVGTELTLPTGLLWQLAERLYAEYPDSKYPEWPPFTSKGIKPEPVDVSVYETSYCSEHTNSLGYEAACGPGYGPMPTQSPNIRTDLCVYISQLGKATCGISYDPPIWVVSQEGVDKDLGHPKALDTSLP